MNHLKHLKQEKTGSGYDILRCVMSVSIMVSLCRSLLGSIRTTGSGVLSSHYCSQTGGSNDQPNANSSLTRYISSSNSDITHHWHWSVTVHSIQVNQHRVPKSEWEGCLTLIVMTVEILNGISVVVFYLRSHERNRYLQTTLCNQLRIAAAKTLLFTRRVRASHGFGAFQCG